MQAFIVTHEMCLALATSLAASLQLSLFEMQTTRFADSEMCISLKNARELPSGHAIVLHALSYPVSDNLVHLLLALHMLKNKGVQKITVVIPYFGYARQDKELDGESGAHFVMRLLREAGADRIVTVELHNPDIIHGAPLPVTNITLDHFIAQEIEKFGVATQWTLIAPDKGAQQRVESIAQEMHVPVMVHEKERYAVNKTRIVGSEGSCDTLKGIVVDDIIDTGSTLMNVAQKLHEEHSACQLFALGIHPVLSKNAASALQDSLFERIWITNTIPQQAPLFSKFSVIDVSPEIARALTALFV
jgi:ribose-phosphate pyrophosphokinase